ncbi:TonB-dependent receptor [Lewinella sp. LCG006]|uniref:TonB-dependent receptor n=1 Tax=Lewinella sp. LCG006 TaxID=3231911 RepID=UPI00345F9739
MKSFYLLLLLMAFSVIGFAQQGTISGTIVDGDEPLYGVSVGVDGTLKGAVTDLDGKYSIKIDPGTYKVVASYVGYSTQTRQVTVAAGGTATADFNLAGGVLIDEVVVTGTRASNRTNLESAVPVDVINVSELASKAPQVSINQLLSQTAPSFSSNTQTISDGTDHIDPASLRGLGPDQVLVLVNGKRRHTTSLVNVNGTFGRGNVGTDLNAIPASAIEKIEILRDGAAAQYGTDAIAGVINVKLREDVNQLALSLTTGANFSDGIGPFGGETKSADGEVINLGMNYGLPLGTEGGFINFSGEFNYRGKTSRMQEFTGQIFNAYNGVERVAAADGADISNLTLEQIQTYAQDVSYLDGETLQALNDLTDISGLAGVLDFDASTQELAARGQDRTDYNMLVGQSEVRGGNFFANMELPLGENAELYSFAGVGYRRGCSGCFFRLPAQDRTSTSIYPDGTVPKINSNIVDRSFGVGLRGMIGDWHTDFSTVYGYNEFLYNITDTHNATLGSSSPTEFDAGGHSFTQSTSNFDLSQYFDGVAGKGVNVAFGGEYRLENYNVVAGSELSYGNYDQNGNLVTPATPSELLVRDYFGRNRPSGAQCFAGFLPSNAVDANRSSAALYLDTEFDLSEAFLLGGAVRFENYSDFGSTFNYKLTGRYKVSDNFAIRAGTSTGFRAPSLHQIHFSRTSTIFNLVDGVSVPQEVGIFANTSRAAKLLGIPELKEETSQSVSLGFTAKIPAASLRLTIDAYQVGIDDRVILTGQFGPGGDAELQSIFNQAGATQAAFFANAINTTSRGIDIVISHSASLGTGGKTLRSDLAATFSKTTWNQDEGINASDLLREKGLVDTYFDQTSRIYLEQAVPRAKVTLGNTLTMNKLTIYLRNTYFGETTEATNANIFDMDLNQIDKSIDPYNAGKVITDLSLGFEVASNLNLTVGANNLLDVYPDEADPSFQSDGRFVYSRRSPQFSFGGRFLFARVAFTLK